MNRYTTFIAVALLLLATAAFAQAQSTPVSALANTMPCPVMPWAHKSVAWTWINPGSIPSTD